MTPPSSSANSFKQTARETTGVPGLDNILGGGLPPYRLYVVEGDPGSGKTTFALQFLLEGVRLGQRVLYVTLSETADELNDVVISHNWTLNGVHLLELNSLSERLDEDANYTVFHPSDVELGDTIRHIRAEVERLNPERVVLDSVSELKILSQTSVRYRREVLALKQFFAGRKCTVLVLDDLSTPEVEQQLQSIGHGVICLERESREYGTTRRQVRVAKMRGVRFHDGHHDFVLRTGGIEVYPRLSAAGAPIQRREGYASSGSTQTDMLLGGGINYGSSTLLIGPAGSGKSTLCSHYLLTALQKGENVACYQFEESQETFLARARGFGMEFEPYIESGQFELATVDIADLSPGEFASRVKKAVDEKDTRLIVIDSLNGYMNGMPSERFLMIHMHELLMYLGHKGVVSLLTVAQHGTVGLAMGSPVDISFLADSVILLRFFEASGAVRQAISVVKKRRGAHERTLRAMTIGAGGMQVGEVLDEFQGILSGIPRYEGKDARLSGAPNRP